MNPSMVLRHAAPLHADQATDGRAGEPPRETAPVAVPFQAVYAEYFRAMWRTLRRLGVPQAELDDAVQDVFIVVHRRLPEFDGRSLRGWLYAIAVRVASDHRRGATQQKTLPLPEALVDPAPDPARASEVGESVRLLHELLAELDEPKREVFVLGELEELSAPEIAEALGENLNTVYARLRAARARFDAAFRRRRARDERSVR
ncbi:MAG TPA: sigma-70 family RNA polymerase sigma factor [Polyangiaceae bacterium]